MVNGGEGIGETDVVCGRAGDETSGSVIDIGVGLRDQPTRDGQSESGFAANDADMRGQWRHGRLGPVTFQQAGLGGSGGQQGRVGMGSEEHAGSSSEIAG
jgi:hypothetical protein